MSSFPNDSLDAQDGAADWKKASYIIFTSTTFIYNQKNITLSKGEWVNLVLRENVLSREARANIIDLFISPTKQMHV